MLAVPADRRQAEVRPVAEAEEADLVQAERLAQRVDVFDERTQVDPDRVDVGGVSIRVARAEDLIIYKAVAFRPQDQQDIERLLTLHGKKIDLSRIRRTIDEFAQAIEEPERLAAFERIVKTVLG